MTESNHSEANYKNKLIVKSNNLIESKYHLSVREQKFIIFLASLVDRNTTHLKQTKVKIKDIELALKGGNDKKWGSIYEVVREVVLSINAKPLSIRKPDGGWIIINWFSMVDADAKQGVITFELSDSIKKQLLQLNEYFTRYRFGNILSLKSGYSIRIYELLKLNQYKGKARYELGHFRELIGVSYLDEHRNWVHKYGEYKIFKNRVLKHAQRELKRETDIYFELKEEREGRSVKYLTFYMFKNSKVKPSHQQELFAEPALGSEINDENYPYNAAVIDAFVRIGLSQEKAKSLYQDGFNVIEDDEIRKKIVSDGRSLDEYLLEKIVYAEFMIAKGDVSNPPGLLLSAIKENYTNQEVLKQKKQRKNKKKRLIMEQTKANKAADLHKMRLALLEKEMKIIGQLMNGKEHFLEELLVGKEAQYWIGFDKDKTARQNFDTSPLVRSRIIGIVKREYADLFAVLEPEQRKIETFAKSIAGL